ncbi:MAG TPA: nicotinamide riboside transporter PnuC [Bacteroidales bacterium]|nr:nicotinamide riboside transporter PnuC [Bacteroidales bacterium]
MGEWLADHFIEIFGALTGILYVFLEIRQNILLWPLGIITSAVYIYVFRENGFYAGMVLQFYYVVISVYGWRVWSREQGAWGSDPPAGGEQTDSGAAGNEQGKGMIVRRIDFKTGVICAVVAIVLWGGLWYTLDRWTDSPVPLWDGLITSMSVVATWMLTRKILEQWHVWIFANVVATVVYLAVGMYPTAILFMVYAVMAVAGLREWRKSRVEENKYETS